MPPAGGYDQLNNNLAPSKSVFDSQQLNRPAVYKHCGRASLCIGIICLMAEVSVFIIKRGLTTFGVGIWTGAPFVIFGAVTLAVPRTQTVCSVSTGFVMGLGCMLLSALGSVACAMHISQIADTLARRSTPRPNFELSCPACGHYIMLKEVTHIGLLLLQFLVSAALTCFAYADCLCCQQTVTEVLLAGDGGGPAAAANSAKNSTTPTTPAPLPPPPPMLQQGASAVNDNQHATASPATVAAVSHAVGGGSGSVGFIGGGRRSGLQQLRSANTGNYQQQHHQMSFAGSSGAIVGGGQLPMLYDL